MALDSILAGAKLKPLSVTKPVARLSELANKVFRFADPERVGLISAAGQAEIAIYCRQQALLVPPPDSERLTWKFNDERGKWPKRYAGWCKWYANNWYMVERQPDAAHLAALGQIAERYTLKDGEVFSLVVKPPPFDWPSTVTDEHGKSRHSFGHKGNSCWWSERSQGKFYHEVFSERGGYALLFYTGEAAEPAALKPEQGIARCWAVQDTDERFIVFNGYYQGQKQTGKLAEIAAHALGLSLQPLKSFSAERVYINKDNVKGSTAYVIGAPTAIKECHAFHVW